MSIYIAGACSVPGCPLEPPKDGNPFCQSHWTRLPGRLRKRLSTIWKSRTKGHHGKVVRGHDWPKAIAAGVRFFGALPRNELPREAQEVERIPVAAATAAVLVHAAPHAEIDPSALVAIQAIGGKTMATAVAEPTIGKDGMIHTASGRTYTPESWKRLTEALQRGTQTRRANLAAKAAGKVASNGDTAPKTRAQKRHAARLTHNGRPNDVVLTAFKDWLLDRYMNELPKPQPEEIFAAGMQAGIDRERAHR